MTPISLGSNNTEVVECSYYKPREVNAVENGLVGAVDLVFASLDGLNDRDHVAVVDGTAVHEDHLPRYFAKAGHVDADPKKTKKDGAGKGNWGRDGDEIEDYAYNMTNPRRRSNSSSIEHGIKNFKTKFETVDLEPTFDEEVHGARPEDNVELEKEESLDSASGGSVEEEDHPKKD
ncbi:MAG: hypothetical protein M1819_002007 [Sarea resinae]|nr:MAG: hypothetical protein M1819_002007 [Sarea resinae]